MKRYAVAIGALVLAVVVTLWVVSVRTAKAPGGACTDEAMICLDGTVVGRTGPNCEFAPCPAGNATSTSLAIGASGTIHGTTIGVLELVEDSRCPVDVQCIQAGTVRVRASVDAYDKDFTFTLGKPQVVGNATITLESVIPAQKYSKQTVAPADYRFTFTVVPKVTATPTGGVRGTVSLGPTCPVMRDPPDPACADKPYATAIIVYRAGSKTPFIVGNSDATGAFKFSLPSGAYTLNAGGDKTLPRCAPVTVTVPATGYVATSISCDTGIR